MELALQFSFIAIMYPTVVVTHNHCHDHNNCHGHSVIGLDDVNCFGCVKIHKVTTKCCISPHDFSLLIHLSAL